MAICECCNKEMLTAKSCTFSKIGYRNGKSYNRIRYGEEEGWVNPPSKRCGDCGVQPGGIHHDGCDLEICPKCENQLLSCDCGFDVLIK